MLNFFLGRLNESSTWKGILFILTFFGVELRPDMQESIITAGIGLAGLWSVITSDKLTSDQTPPTPTEAPKTYPDT